MPARRSALPRDAAHRGHLLALVCVRVDDVDRRAAAEPVRDLRPSDEDRRPLRAVGLLDPDRVAVLEAACRAVVVHAGTVAGGRAWRILRIGLRLCGICRSTWLQERRASSPAG